MATRVQINEPLARAHVSALGDKAMHVLVAGIADDARRGVPVRTGRLRRSIYSRVLAAGGSVVGRVGARTSYAAFVELGTRKMAAQPYLRPALYRRREI